MILRLVLVCTALCACELAAEPPAEPTRPIPVVGQVAVPMPSTMATWPIPPEAVDIVEVAVEATEPDTGWACWIWTGAMMGPRSHGLVVHQDAAEAIGVVESVVVDVGPVVANRRDRLLSCEASAPSIFHGLRVWPRAAQP